MTEITEDRDFKTNINVESQTISYIKNPEKFKEDLQKAKNEIYDIYHAVDSTVNLQGEETRSPIEQVGEVRQAKVIYNLIDSRLQEAENKEDIAKAFEAASEDLGYEVKVIYTDPSNSPQLIGVDKNGNTYIKDGTAYVDENTGIGYILVNTKSPANSTKAGAIGTIAEEQSHVIGKKEGRQKVVLDGSEKGLESLGRPTNDYFKKQYSKNDKAIELKSDGKDYSNVDFGENVGDASNPEDLKFKEYYRKDILSKDPNYKKIKFLVSMGTNMIPGVGEVKLGIEMFVGEDLLTEEKYDLIDRVQIGTSISKNISSRGINRLENQLSNSKNSQKFQLIKTELDTRNQQGQNGQQHQRGQNSVVQNNKNSINKTQPQGNQDYSGNQQVSKGATSNKQQEAPISKTSDTNKSGINQGVTNAKQKSISTNTNVKDSGVLDNGTKYVVIESSSEKIKSVDELLTKEGQAKLPNTSLKELEVLFKNAGYKTDFSDARGSGGGQRLIIQGHKTEDGQSIGSIRSNTSAGTHKSNYKIISGNFKNENGENIGGKRKIVEGSPDSYNTRGNTPEKAEIIFVEKKEENK